MDRLKDAGFAVDTFRWQSELEKFGGAKNMFGLIENEVVFLARRPASSDLTGKVLTAPAQ